MKTIIVPTDYSENAQNATAYAAALAKASNATLNLLHVFHLPAEIGNTPIRLTSLEDLTKKHKVYLKNIAKDISLKYSIKVKSHVYPGFISDILPNYVKQRKGDLVVMGMRGMNPIEKLLFGSITTHFLKSAILPLLIVPSISKFHPIKNILLACDYHTDVANYKLGILKDSALTFNAEVRVLHVGHAEADMAELEERVSTGQYFEQLFRGVNHSFTHVDEEDIEKGIQSAIKSFKADLLVMIPRKRNFWEKLTSRSNSNRIAFNIDIPLLALPPVSNK